MLFAREFPLLTLEPVAFVREVDRFDRVAVSVVCILQDAQVDANDVLRILWFLWRVVGRFDTENSESLARRFLFHRGLFDRSVVG